MSVGEQVDQALAAFGFYDSRAGSKGRGSSLDEVREFELAHSVRLPDDYRWFVQSVGGGTTNGAMVVTDRLSHSNSLVAHALVIDEFFALHSDVPGRRGRISGLWGAFISDFWGDLVEDQDVNWSRSLMPFAGHDSYGWFCFDFRYDAVCPPVIHVDPDGLSDLRSWPDTLQFVADSFLDLLRKIVRADNVEVPITSTAPVDDESPILVWSRQRDLWLGVT